MKRGQLIEIRDEISGLCPACDKASISFTCTSVAGNNVYLIRKYVVYCDHQAMCKLRHDYMEASQ